MRLQFGADTLRIRLTRAEFESVRAGEYLELSTHLVGGLAWSAALVRGDALGLDAGDGRLTLTVPAFEIESFAGTLPSRHGLAFDWPRPTASPLHITLDVDIHDGRRTPR